MKCVIVLLAVACYAQESDLALVYFKRPVKWICNDQRDRTNCIAADPETGIPWAVQPPSLQRQLYLEALMWTHNAHRDGKLMYTWRADLQRMQLSKVK